eukprot:gene13351-9183_t
MLLRGKLTVVLAFIFDSGSNDCDDFLDERMDSDLQYVPTGRIIGVNVVVQLAIILTGVVEFGFLTIRFRLTRWYSNRVQEENPVLHRIINAELQDAHQHADSATIPPGVDRLDGLCCGCGRAANDILIPCFHAVCCSQCGVKATHCPHCNTVVTGHQRLHFEIKHHSVALSLSLSLVLLNHFHFLPIAGIACAVAF